MGVYELMNTHIEYNERNLKGSLLMTKHKNHNGEDNLNKRKRGKD